MVSMWGVQVRAEERKAFDEELQQKLLEAHASQEAALEETKVRRPSDH